MPRFFVEVAGVPGALQPIVGEDAAHIARSLRMRPGEKIELADGRGRDYLCEIVSVDADLVEVKILSTAPSSSEHSVQMTLYAAVTKGEKMDMLVQKAVELGVSAIVPVITKRCVHLPDEKSAKNKLQRWNKIALEASKQSGRGRVPIVSEFIGFREAVQRAAQSDLPLMAYERADKPLRDVLESAVFQSCALLTGPEGGLEESEVQEARQQGLHIISLGRRILRAETAPLYVLSVLSYLYE